MADLTKLLAQLDVFSSKDSHKEVRDTAMQILETSPTPNVNTLKQALVANINLDNYSDAFNVIVEHSNIVSGNEEFLKLELAYVYYKFNKGRDLISLSKSVSVNLPFKHILAQFYYRNGQEVEALEIYKELINEDENVDEDICVNERAVISQLRYKGIKVEPISNSTGSYDEIFNDSLIDIIDGKYKQGLSKLDHAKAIINESNELSNDEKKIEILPIEIQRAYVLSLTGAIEESENTLKSLLDTCSNEALKLIIINNLMALKTNLEVFEPTLLYRELNFPYSVANTKDRLSYTQELLLKRNEQLLAKLSGKGIDPFGFNMKFKYNGLPDALARIEDFNSLGLKSLGKLAINQGNIGLSLLAVQFAISKGNLLYGVLILEKLIESSNGGELLSFPGIGKTLYSLYESLDQKNKMFKLLQSIYDILNTIEVDIELETYVIFIALKLMSIDETKAHALLEKYQKGDITDVKFTQDDISLLVNNVDIESLISNGVTPLLRDTTHHKIAAKKPKRKQKLRHVSKAKTIDPERWLALKDRSNYKPKKGKRDTQGS